MAKNIFESKSCLSNNQVDKVYYNKSIKKYSKRIANYKSENVII